MGLMGTLAKVAIGYAAARGVDRMSGGKGLQGLLGGAQVKSGNPAAAAQAQIARSMSPDAAGAQAQNPFQDMMNRVQQGGLGGFMGAGASGNPMAAMMQSMQGKGMPGAATPPPASDGSTAGPGDTGMAGMLAAAGGVAAMQGKSVASLLDSFNTRETVPEAEAAAGLMLRAMIQAAKADGAIDASEKAKILESVGEDVDQKDIAFIKEQLAAPVDVAALAADTPAAQRMQVYSASLMTIDVDTSEEAQYLDQLAKAMELDEVTVNTLHMQMGIHPLYS